MKFKKFGKALLMSALSAGVVLSVTSCVQSYTVGFLYVTGTVTADPSGNGIITGFKIDHNTGRLRPIDGLPVSSGGANPVRAILLSGSRFLYVLNQGVSDNPAGSSICTTQYPCKNSNITQFAVGGNGVLTPQETFYTQGVNPFRIIGDSAGNYIYVLDHDSPDPSSTSSDPVVATSNANCSAALTGATTCGDITAFQVNATTGRLTLVVNNQVSVSNCGTSSTSCPLTYFPVPVNPIDFVLASSNFLTLSGTPATGDSVFPYTYSAGSGQLTVNQNSSQTLNAHAATAIDSGGGYIYVLDNEPITYTPTGSSTPITAPSQILPFTVGTNGALQAQTGGAVPDDPTLANPIALMVETPKGSWVYVANAGNNNTSSGLTQDGIAGYVIDPSSKQLTTMPGEPFGVGSGPQCIVEDPSNQFIYEGNFNDSTVTGQSIDQNAGVLVPLLQSTRAPSSYALTGPATWCLVDGRTS
ncbi:MAG: beta-propeller fold lactonase family protein [Terracidiphilus sp.]|jgi:6-phosphogluconolactonase (cycloisomerase 2 family)